MKQTLLEKYRPKTLNDVVLPKNIKTLLTNTTKNNGWRLMLYSSPGTGKTSTARVITSEHDVLYLSGSNDFNIETLRQKVYTFCSNNSIINKQKSIIIDEFENVRDNLQDAFKIILDQASKVNFIFITNEIEKVNVAVRSRCTNVDYNFIESDLEEQKKLYLKFIKDVCTIEKIDYEPSALFELFKINFPDFRHILVNIQEIIDKNGSISSEYILTLADNGKQLPELYNIILNNELDSKQLYIEISKFKGKEKECLLSLGEPFFKYLDTNNKYNKILESALVVSRYCSDYPVTINKFISLYSCIVELRQLFI